MAAPVRRGGNRISTVDPDARHGHKTASRGFDGYKDHIAEDPDSEIITDTTVTPGNAGGGTVAETLIEDILDRDGPDDGAIVYGDSAYGGGEFQQRLEDEGIDSGCRIQPPSAPKGRFAKDQFRIDLNTDTVTCPNQATVTIRGGNDGTGIAYFADACTDCPLRDSCTEAAGGRTIRVGIHEAALARARERQQASEWQDDYRSTRPKVEGKLGHLMRRRHGGRRARVRGTPKSTRTSTCSPPPPTWPAWPCSDCTPHRLDGGRHRMRNAPPNPLEPMTASLAPSITSPAGHDRPRPSRPGRHAPADTTVTGRPPSSSHSRSTPAT